MSNSNTPFDWFQQFWNSANIANNRFNWPLTAKDIEQKIAELSILEQWLTMQLAMVDSGIKALELQKSGLAAFTNKQEAAPVET